MSITVTCICGRIFRTDDRFAGRTTQCPSCGGGLLVPGTPDGASPSEADGSSRVDDFVRKHVTDAYTGRVPGDAASMPVAAAVQPRRPMLEVLLDPRSIQWMLTLGGGLMVLGLIIWLASFPFFKRADVLAVVMGGLTLVVLGAGWFLALRTRYKSAGQALACLACVVAPLNLWFYHAQNLITLDGHLWLAGLVCCGLYAATAYMLRDPLFIYAFEVGITLTMLLLLAELDRVADMSTLSLALAAIGLVSIHAERAFAPEASVFSRKRFGMAMFWSGQAQLGAGLLILLAAQILTWTHAPIKDLFRYDWSTLNTETFPLLPAALWLAGAYAYLYSDIVVRRIGVYTFLAAFCVLLAEVTVIGWSMPDGPAMIAALAATAMAANVLWSVLPETQKNLRRVLPPLGVALAALPLALAFVLHIRGTSALFKEGWPYSITWWYVAAMAGTAITARVSAHLLRHEKVAWPATHFFYSAAAVLMAGAGLLTMLGLTAWHQQAPALMLAPIAYMVASRLWRGQTPERPLAWVALTATAILAVHVVFGALISGRSFVTASVDNLWYALFFGEAAIFYMLSAVIRRRGMNVYLAAAMAAGAVWQLLAWGDVPEQYYAATYALLGLPLLIIYRLAGRQSFESRGIALHAFQCANMALTAAFAAEMLQGLALLASSRATRIDLIVAALTAGISLLAFWLVHVSGWKRWYLTTTVGLGGLTFIMINVLSLLSAWQKFEIFCVIAGIAILIFSYLGHWREDRAQPSETISLGLWLGSILATLPLVIAVLFHRFGMSEVSVWNELALLTVSVIMVLTGYLLQFKSTTLIGGAALVSQLLILVIFVGMQAQVALGVYLAVGGALLFGAGVMLAMYRDRLMQLPQRMAKHEGVFKIFGWR